nr:uncharacterized protein C1orf43 homolog [Ciona intestinalis]|eukprot:XP_002120744.1 uncharacterized protein C1orf43 homolog [Ciona intestinalis]
MSGVESNITVNSTTTIFSWKWTGINLLLVLIYGFITVLLVAIFAKRTIHRVSLKFSHRVEPEGAGAEKSLKHEIHNLMEVAVNFSYEPTLLQPGDERLHAEFKQKVKYSYITRMKTVDGFRNIDQVLGDLNDDLRRPKGKNIRQHLFDAKSHSSGCLRSIRTNQLQTLADFYVQARYGAESYHPEDHQKFLDTEAEIIATLRQRTHRKRTKEKRRDLHRQNASVSDPSSNEDIEITLKPDEDEILPLEGNDDQPLLEEEASSEVV